jgi:hypothetical protein
MNTGVAVEMTANVNIARALLTNSMLKVLARTYLSSIRNHQLGNTDTTYFIDAVNIARVDWC